MSIVAVHGLDQRYAVSYIVHVSDEHVIVSSSSLDGLSDSLGEVLVLWSENYSHSLLEVSAGFRLDGGFQRVSSLIDVGIIHYV